MVLFQIGTGRTRLELIKQHLLTIMHHLLSPEKGSGFRVLVSGGCVCSMNHPSLSMRAALLVNMCPDYARPDKSRCLPANVYWTSAFLLFDLCRVTDAMQGTRRVQRAAARVSRATGPARELQPVIMHLLLLFCFSMYFYHHHHHPDRHAAAAGISTSGHG